ncbi:unnamed protein product [Rhizophagus irregularis]|nr:unnamed protein product [Rhizophagus irregularis]
MKHTEITLSKHPKVRKIIDPKTVICICGKKVRLDRNYDPDLLDRHVKNKICKSSDGNSQITQFFSTQNSETSNTKRKLCVGLNDEKVKLYLRRIGFVTTFGGAPPPEIVARELFGDKIKSSFHWNDLNKKENDQLLDTLRSQAKWINDSTTFCVRSTECSTYVDGIGEICRQCLNLKKLKVFMNAIDKPIPKEKNQKYTPLILYKNSPFYQYCKNANVMELLRYFNDPEDCTPKFWNQLARMGRAGAFKDKQIFSGLCEIFVEMTNRINEGKGLQNIRYPEQFSNFLTILASSSPQTYAIFQKNLAGRTIRNIRVQRAQSDLAIDDPSICFENMAKFRKFLNSINYDGPIAASSDNTKLEEKLRYSASLGAILGSTFPLQETLISSYSEIDTIVKKIQTNNAIAKYVRVYILQVPVPKVPPFVLGIIPNNSENVADVYEIHNQVLELAAHFKIHILSIGADGASIEIKAQKNIMQANTQTKLEFNDELYNIKLHCPVIPNIGPIVCISDPKHAKKNGRNSIFSGARMLTFGDSFLGFGHVLGLSKSSNSALYHADVLNVDKQDDGAAYRLFSHEFLYEVTQTLNSDSKNKGLLVYLFIIGELIDSYLNRDISNHERIKMVMISSFFLRIWEQFIQNASDKYEEIFANDRNFLAHQTYEILSFLVDSMILLIIAHREYYNSMPLLPWMHGSEACEHFFGMARQHLPDFTYADLIYLIPKIRHVTNAYYNSAIVNPNSEYKTSRVGYICDYFEGNVDNLNSSLKIWPTDDEIRVLINDAYREANALAKCVSMVVTLLPLSPIDLLTSEMIPVEEDLTKEFRDGEEILAEIAEMMENVASLNLRNNTDEDLIDAREQITNLSNNTYLQQIYDNNNPDILDNNGNVIFDLLHQRRKYHKAYTSKKMIRSQFQERDYNSSEINPSIASKIVAQVTNNNNNTRLPKARLER